VAPELVADRYLIVAGEQGRRAGLSMVRKAVDSSTGRFVVVKYVKARFDALAKKIVANSDGRINLGRGVDIFQFAPNGAFALAVKLQRYRQVKSFSVTYIREGEGI
jgi:hypothetical protein